MRPRPPSPPRQAPVATLRQTDAHPAPALAPERIRVGLVGAGGNTRLRHIPGFRAIAGVEVVSVANRTRASSERAARELGIPVVYDDWRALVEADDTDAICIGTWPYLHCPATLAALAAGKHVLCEARMALDAREAGAMLAAARRHPRLVTQLVPAPHTLAVDATIQRLVAEAYLGDLLAVELRVLQPAFVDRAAPLHWRQDRDLSGFNVLTLGIWYEILMRWTGPATRVAAMARVVVPRRQDPQGVLRAVTVPDHVDVLADLASGAIAHLRFSAVTGLAPANEAWLFGSDGTLRLDLASLALSGGRRGDTALLPIPVPEHERGSWRVEAEFVDAIRGRGIVTRTRFEDGVRYMEFTEAVARSAASGRAVPLPL